MRPIIVYYRIWVVGLKPHWAEPQFCSTSLICTSAESARLSLLKGDKVRAHTTTAPSVSGSLSVLYKMRGIFPSYLPVNRSKEMINRRYFTSSIEMTKLLKMVMVVFCFKKTKQKTTPETFLILEPGLLCQGCLWWQPWQGLTANLITGN